MESPRISAFSGSLIVLGGVLLAQLLMLGFQLRTQTDIPLVRFGTVLMVEPIQRAMNATAQVIRDTWLGYIDLRDAREGNKSLAATVDQLRLENQRLQTEAAQAPRLRSLLDMKSLVPVETVAARVLGGSAGESSRLIMIDKGASSGIKPDVPVMVPDGVVGKVLAVFSDSAQVILLTDPFSGAGVLLEQTRMHGVLKGRNEPLLQLDFIPNGERVATGQRVFTSGEDKIYPPGLAVGVVESAGPGQKFLDVKVRPLAALQSLEEVLVILRTDFAQPLPEPVRLGPEAPSRAITGTLPKTAPSAASATPAAAPSIPAPAARSNPPSSGIAAPRVDPATGSMASPPDSQGSSPASTSSPSPSPDGER